MADSVYKALTLTAAALIVFLYIYFALSMGIQNTWSALVIPGFAFPMIFFFYFYLNQNPSLPFKGPIILHCPNVA